MSDASPPAINICCGIDVVSTESRRGVLFDPRLSRGQPLMINDLAHGFAGGSIFPPYHQDMADKSSISQTRALECGEANRDLGPIAPPSLCMSRQRLTELTLCRNRPRTAGTGSTCLKGNRLSDLSQINHPEVSFHLLFTPSSQGLR